MSSEKGGDIANFVKGASEHLSSGNYNEMDGLVLAQLSYSKFEDSNVNWTFDELTHGVTVPEFAQKILTSQHVSPSTPRDQLSDEQAFLMEMANSPRYENCTITDLTACEKNAMWDAGRTSSLSEDAQWAAMTIHMNDGSDASVISMRGTASEFGWSEDLELGYDAGGTTAQKLSRDYLQSVDSDHIYLTGHSKGGNDVSAAYMMSDKSVRDRVVQVNNYDGPGSNKELIERYSEGYAELANKQKNYFPEDSVIGHLLTDPPGEHIYVNADTEGHTDIPILGQHDAYSWNTDGTGLDHGDQSEISKMINRVLDSTLNGMSSGERGAVLKAMIALGVPALIDHGSISKEQWDNLLMNVMHYPFKSVESIWATLRTIHTLIDETIQYGVIHTIGFVFPGLEDFTYWIKDCFADMFRQFHNTAEGLWNSIWNGIFGGGSDQQAVNDGQVYDFGDDTQGEYAENVRASSSFSIKPAIIRSNAKTLADQSAVLKGFSNEVIQIRNSFKGFSRVMAELPFAILAGNLSKCSNNMASLSDSLDQCAIRYAETEDAIVGKA